MKKYAIAQTYGLQVFEGNLSYVEKMTKTNVKFTEFVERAILFDSIEEAITFAKKKNSKWNIADHLVRSTMYVQDVTEVLESDGNLEYRDDKEKGLLLQESIEAKNARYLAEHRK